MRKLLMLLVFCLASTVMFAQQTKNNWFKITRQPKINYENKTKKEFVKGEMDQTKWIIESLDKYKKESSLGYQIQFLGAAVGAVSFGYSGSPDQGNILIASGVIVFVGYFISANAVRHLNKNNLTFTGNGLALRF